MTVAEPSCQLVRELPSLLQVAELEQTRWDLQPEVALAVLASAEVADQGHERPDLAAREGEVDSVYVLTAQLAPGCLHGLQLVPPVPPADHTPGEGPPVQ